MTRYDPHVSNVAQEKALATVLKSIAPGQEESNGFSGQGS